MLDYGRATESEAQAPVYVHDLDGMTLASLRALLYTFSCYRVSAVSGYSPWPARIAGSDKSGDQNV